jgi:hypothetical protein
MRNRLAQQRQDAIFEGAVDRAAGRVRILLSFTSEQELTQRIADIEKLPTAENNITLQDEDGNFLFLPNYSALDGPVVLG